jgi:putative transposase
VKPVCAVLGVARSHVIDRLARPAHWVDGGVLAKLDPARNAMIADAVRAEVTAYHVMKAHGLLLPKAPKRPDSGRPHDGKVAVDESNQRWCSDGFEIACDNGEVVTGVVMKDAATAKFIAWRVWIACLGKSFGE